MKVVAFIKVVASTSKVEVMLVMSSIMVTTAMMAAMVDKMVAISMVSKSSMVTKSMVTTIASMKAPFVCCGSFRVIAVGHLKRTRDVSTLANEIAK